MREYAIPDIVCDRCAAWPCVCRRTAIRQACVCGLEIVAATDEPDDIRAAVLRHTVEPVHQAWRARAGL